MLLGLRPSRQLSLGLKRRPSTPPFASDQIADLAFKIPAASAELRDFNRTATDTSASVEIGTLDLMSIASSAVDQSVQPPHASQRQMGRVTE